MERMEQINKIKELGYDQETSEKYTAGQDAFFNKEKVADGATIEMVSRVRPLNGVQTVADIGCGSNISYLQLWKENSHANTVIGVEPSPYMRGLLEQKITPLLKDKLVVSEGDWTNTHLDANSIDLVMSRFSLHNIRNISEGYRELARILKPGAHAVISLPHPNYCKKELESKGLKAVEGTPMAVDIFGTTLHYFYHEIDAYLGDTLSKNHLELVESDSLNWGTKDTEEASIPNTLVFTVKKII